MSKYKREISYIYSYKYDKKSGNVGFVCLDAREELCRVNISLRTPYELPAENLQVYMFINENDKMTGINIGSFPPINNMCRYRTTVNRNNIADTGYSVEKTSGIYIFSKEHPQYVFAATWNGSGIEGMKFEEYTPKITDVNAKSSVIEIIKEYINNEQKEQIC